jgi:hypothetical protein
MGLGDMLYIESFTEIRSGLVSVIWKAEKLVLQVAVAKPSTKNKAA